MLGRTYSATHSGIDGKIVEVETAGHNALPGIQITGLAGEAVKESRERVRTCLSELGFKVPSRQLIVHLSPASEKKQGSHFDLAIAVSILVAEGILDGGKLLRTGFLGEVTLDGRVRSVKGALSLLEALERSAQIERILVPEGNAFEVALLDSKKAILVSSVAQTIEILRGRLKPAREIVTESPVVEPVTEAPLLDEIEGQALGKRALMVALAGRHPVLFMGAPGVGKSMLAGCSQRLLPPLHRLELIEVEKIYAHSASQSLRESGDIRRPFRSPHHTASPQAVLGGGTQGIYSGEISLSHSGVLFLDELPEFRQDVLEGLREPMQTGEVNVSRVGETLRLPARTFLIAAMNPCPCGFSLEMNRRCQCAPSKVSAYRRKLSGPLIDRFGLFACLSLPCSRGRAGKSLSHGEASEAIARAWKAQEKRFGASLVKNGDVQGMDRFKGFELGKSSSAWLEDCVETERMSFRKRNQLVRVARTIADILESESIELEHLLEAWSFRCPESFRSPFVS